MEKIFTILIVDDEQFNRTVLTGIFESEYIIQLAKNGGQAIEIATKTQPDLILLDILMPDIDGYTVCKHLKADPATQNIPIIFITAKSEDDDELKGFHIGAVDYITKPFRTETVKARVKNHLELKQYRDQMEKLVADRTKDLEETNTALRVLLRQRDETQKKAEEKILTNIKESILPFIKKIRHDQLSPSQQTYYLDAIEFDLNSMVEPFSGGLHSKKYQLTPTEIQLADMIKNGNSTKTIANELSISTGTVQWHRENIREKIGIKNQKINLKNYLKFIHELD